MTNCMVCGVSLICPNCNANDMQGLVQKIKNLEAKNQTQRKIFVRSIILTISIPISITLFSSLFGPGVAKEILDYFFGTSIDKTINNPPNPRTETDFTRQIPPDSFRDAGDFIIDNPIGDLVVDVDCQNCTDGLLTLHLLIEDNNHNYQGVKRFSPNPIAPNKLQFRFSGNLEKGSYRIAFHNSSLSTVLLRFQTNLPLK